MYGLPDSALVGGYKRVRRVVGRAKRAEQGIEDTWYDELFYVLLDKWTEKDRAILAERAEAEAQAQAEAEAQAKAEAEAEEKRSDRAERMARFRNKQAQK